MKKQVISMVALAAIAMAPVQQALAHCQIPCGIYGDDTRFTLMEEHITTIEKSMNEIVSLSGSAQNNVNQLVRWVNNKEDHADEFTEIVTYYFLAQRIKPDAPQYTEKLELLHGLMVSAMKCKQTTDLQNVRDLRAGLAKFEELYMDKEAKAHLEVEHGPEHNEQASAPDADSASLQDEAFEVSARVAGSKE